MPDVTPEAIARRRAKGGPKDKKGDGLSFVEKVQAVYGLLLVGLFLFSIFACYLLFKLVFVGFALR